MTRSGAAEPSVALAPVGASRSLPLSPAVIVLLASALIAVPLVVLSILNTAGLRSLWDNLHWCETAVAAAIATALAIRGATGRVRAVRIAGAIAFFLWMIVNLLWAYLNVIGQATVPDLLPRASGMVAFSEGGPVEPGQAVRPRATMRTARVG